jgi:large subunit ribosomal protein L5
MQEFDLNNMVNLEKIIINVGVGRMSGQPNFTDKLLPAAIEEISLITGQKPRICSAKKSIAGFKLRAGTPIGLKVTLRRQRMAEFLRKLINAVLPRVRDFRGIKPASVDASGNLTIGLKDHLVFPEISPDISKINFGMEITIVPKLRDKTKAVELYKTLGIPFKR